MIGSNILIYNDIYIYDNIPTIYPISGDFSAQYLGDRIQERGIQQYMNQAIFHGLISHRCPKIPVVG